MNIQNQDKKKLRESQEEGSDDSIGWTVNWLRSSPLGPIFQQSQEEGLDDSIGWTVYWLRSSPVGPFLSIGGILYQQELLIF